MKLSNLIKQVAQKSENNGVQITTYADGPTEVIFIDPDKGMMTAQGPDLVGTLRLALEGEMEGVND